MSDPIVEILYGCVPGYLWNALDHQGGATPKDALALFVGAGTITFIQPTDDLIEALVHVDQAVAAVSAAASVRGANVDALPASTRVGNVLTASANGDLNAAAVFDGLTLAVGEEVFVWANTPADSGPYVVTDLGGAGSKFVFTRRAAETGAVVIPAERAWFVREGTSMAGHSIRTLISITVNTTSWAPMIAKGIKLRRTFYGTSGSKTWKHHLYATHAPYKIRGGGGGGHYAASTAVNGAVGGGGASGATVTGVCWVLDPSITVVVGAGGAGGVAATATAPTAGADTTFTSAGVTRYAKGGGVGVTRAGTGSGAAAGGANVAGSTAEGGADDVSLDPGRDGSDGLQLTIANVMGGDGGDNEGGGHGKGGAFGGGAGAAGNGHGAGGGGASAPAGGGGTNNNGGAGAVASAEFIETS